VSTYDLVKRYGAARAAILRDVLRDPAFLDDPVMYLRVLRDTMAPRDVEVKHPAGRMSDAALLYNDLRVLCNFHEVLPGPVDSEGSVHWEERPRHERDEDDA
jgi:hypothetical protein